MLRPPLACHKVLCLTILLSFSVCMFAQSQDSQTTGKKPFTSNLKVVSAEYFPRGTDSAAGTDATALADLNKQVDTIRYTLRNDSQKAVTAYDLEISYTSDGKPVGYPGGFGTDLANIAMTADCLPPGSDSAIAHLGAIEPGATYTDSTGANANKEELSGGAPTVHVRVVGVIWSDGTFEGEGFGLDAVKHDLDRRRKDAEAGAKVIAIFEAHQDDPDIHHRIAEVAKAIQALVDEVPAVQNTSAGRTYGNSASGALIEPLGNLRIFESTPYPKEFFEGYSTEYECRYKHLAAQVGADASLEVAK